jgi:ZIP family zinc transporter
LFAVAVDLFVDGLLVGTSYAVGAKQGVLVAIALGACGFFLAMTTVASFQAKGASRKKNLGVTLSLMLITAGGVYLAHLFSAELVGGLRSGTLAFATAALLYLVVEELITEAHEAAEDRAGTPAFFFAGFLLVYLLQQTLG